MLQLSGRLRAGKVERSVDGMKLPTGIGLEIRGGAGAAVEIGMDEGM
jgi:hypothetical protein